MFNSKTLHLGANLIGLLLINLLLGLAFYFQFVHHDLPCPLCLIQRIAFAGMGIAIIFNLNNGIKTQHYALMQLFGLLGLIAACRQILLHIIPGDPGYGPPVIGLHLYTWSALFSLIALVLINLVLLFDCDNYQPNRSKGSRLIIMLFLCLVGVNAGAALLECGLGECPADPTHYQLLS